MALKKGKNENGRKFRVRDQTPIEGDAVQVPAHMPPQREPHGAAPAAAHCHARKLA